MDDLFLSKIAKKFPRSDTYCQLFVTDKGIVRVVPIKSKSEVLLEIKQFAKEIGALQTVMTDATTKRKS